MLSNDGSAWRWPLPIVPPLGVTDRGLISGKMVLVRMVKAGGSDRLAVDEDADRVVAMLSVAVGRPVARDHVVPHIQAASDYWQHGDKALANLRLVFAGLPGPADEAAVERLRLAMDLLDNGLAPNALMKALWPYRHVDSVRRVYDPDEPRRQSAPGRGEWTTDDSGGPGGYVATSARDNRILVAETDDQPPPKKVLPHQENQLLGQPEPGELRPHIRTSDPFTELAGGVSATPEMSVSISLSRFGEAAQHMLDAQALGKPSLLTIDRTSAATNRAAALKGIPKVPGMQLDEYPPAMFSEGGKNASVRPISPAHNQALGSFIGRCLLRLPNGAQIELKVVP